MRIATTVVCWAVLLAQGCTAREIPWSITNAEERAGTRYRVELRESCDGASLERAVIARGSAAPRWSIPTGRAISVVAIDESCRVYASACRPVTRDDAALEITLEPVRPEYAECAAASCKDGECSDADAGLGRFDGSTDCGGVPDETPCGPSECTEFSGCTFSDECTNEGSRVRVCNESVCEGGECVRRQREDRALCPRDTEGFSCANGNFCDNWGPCIGTTLCARDGMRTRECTEARCAGGRCQQTVTPQEESCTRETDGMACSVPRCGSWGPCEAPSVCEFFGVQARTCEAMRCQAERCGAPSTYEETMTCARVEDRVCDDGNRCTVDDRCGVGLCQGTCPLSGATPCNCSAPECFMPGSTVCP